MTIRRALLASIALLAVGLWWFMRPSPDPREARVRAGGLAQASESVRDQSAVRWVRDFFRDTRHGAHLLARSPLFAAAAIGSLALGIGANTLIPILLTTR